MIHRKLKIIGTLLVIMLLVVACDAAEDEMEDMGGMEMEGEVSTGELAPLVGGLYEGSELSFIHTEASDEQVAEMLTEMMGPQVVLVPELAEAPPELLANVYVFTNGVEGDGPFGFQPDVFDSVPGDEGYRPLRTINLVAWAEGANSRVLASVAEIQEAEEAGELTVTQPGVVANMPVLVWSGGSR